LGNTEISAVCGKGKRKLPGQLHVQVEAAMFIVAAGQIQDPYVPIWVNLGRVDSFDGSRCPGVTAQSLVGDHVCLVVFARGYSDVTLGGQNFICVPPESDWAKLSVKS